MNQTSSARGIPECRYSLGPFDSSMERASIDWERAHVVEGVRRVERYERYERYHQGKDFGLGPQSPASAAGENQGPK